MIGATTIEEYRKYVEKDAALERRFQPIQVEQPSEEETVQILKGLRPLYEGHHRVAITDDALEAAVALSARYISDRFLPDKAIDLLDEAAAKSRLGMIGDGEELNEVRHKIREAEEKLEQALIEEDFVAAKALREQREQFAADEEKLIRKNKRKNSRRNANVTEREIADVVSGWTKIPVSRLTESEATRLKNLEKTLQTCDRSDGGSHSGIAGRAPRQGRTEGSEAADRFVSVSRTDRCREDRGVEGAR